MKVIARVADMRAEWGRAQSVGLVPTMGSLHAGHLSLLKAARSQTDRLVMSLFVNPAQFGPREDFASYPRDADRDLQLAEAAGVDVVFMPGVEEIYPPGYDTWVEVETLTRRWEGEYRPGHFRGVATVVLKLLQVVRPDYAFFGEKDYQQLLVVKKMVSDLHVPVRIISCPTIREPSGLALSSRNAYLPPNLRERASVLYRAFDRARQLAARGLDDVSQLLGSMQQVLSLEPEAKLEYLALVDSDTLEPLDRLLGEARVLAAMYFGSVRLIDNIAISLGSETSSGKAEKR